MRFVSTFILLTTVALTSGSASENAARVPRPSPEMVVRLNGGEQLLLSKYRGKVVALEFLLTTCPHCQRCSGVINKLYEEYGPKGFQPIGAAVNDGAENLVIGFVHNLGLKFPVGVANREMAYNYLGITANTYFPTLVFIDRKGVIRAQYSGDNEFFKDEEPNIRKMIESLLKDNGSEKPGPSAK
jgi:thiol-disulfide isomerase/thioredoxin